MKHALYSLLAVAVMVCLSSGAFAEGAKDKMQPAGPYTTMEPAAGDPTRQTKLGMQDVGKIQNALNRKGYNAGPVDGIWGPMTERALRNFQQSNGLDVTGSVTSETLAELGIKTGAQESMPEKRMMDDRGMEMDESQSTY